MKLIYTVLFVLSCLVSMQSVACITCYGRQLIDSGVDVQQLLAAQGALS